MSAFDLLKFRDANTNEVNSGWIPPKERTPEVERSANLAKADSPKFSDLAFAIGDLPKKVVINWLQAEAIKKLRQYIPAEWTFDTTIDGAACQLFKNIQQNSGSCVGTRHTRMTLDHTVYEAYFRDEPEKIVFPYTMYHYANGRAASGIRSKGEGSTGHGQKQALEKDGVIPFTFAGYPAPKIANEIEWTGSQEIAYSIPSSFKSDAFEEGRKHKFDTGVLVDSLEAVRAILASGRSIAFCSDWGGVMEAPMVSGLRYVKRRGDTWNHCWGIDGYWMDHPQLGEIYHLTNNWGEAHGMDPTTGDSFGFWVPPDVIDYILGGEETYSFLDLQGFPDDVRQRSAFFDLRYKE
jgi:hypothetical protein